MKKNTIIFDLDGTLLNTLADLHSSFNYAITSFGFPARTFEEIKSFVGNGIRLAIERALPSTIQEEDLEKVVSYFKIYYKDHMHEKTQPYEGIIPMLEELKKRGFKMAVVSNKYDMAVKELTKKYFGNYINIAIGEGIGIEKKPKPDGVLKAIKELNSSIEESIYVGDSDVDIKTAQNINMDCISVLWGFRDKEFLKQNGATIFAATPHDIINILENL